MGTIHVHTFGTGIRLLVIDNPPLNALDPDMHEKLMSAVIDTQAEQAAMAEAELIVWLHPFHWYSMPSLMKLWVDEVLGYGWAYGHDGRALQGKDLTVYGTGQQSRSFAYVADIVEWLRLLADAERAVGEVVNLGNPEEVTIAELARRVIAVTGARVGITHVPYEKAYDRGFEDMPRRVPDISKVTALTGHTPRVSLDEALRRTRDWFVGERPVEQSAPVVVNTIAV